MTQQEIIDVLELSRYLNLDDDDDFKRLVEIVTEMVEQASNAAYEQALDAEYMNRWW